MPGSIALIKDKIKKTLWKFAFVSEKLSVHFSDIVHIKHSSNLDLKMNYI